MNFRLFLAILGGYLIGSIPWALIIGKTFYGKDIRQYGSGNLGGTNAARHLSKPVGIAIMVLDALKAFIYMWILSGIDKSLIPYAGLAVCIGHCFPVFAGFKGGKAVACSCGYVLAINVFLENQIILAFIVPMLVFVTVMFLTKYMALASMSGLVSAAIMGFVSYHNKTYALLISLLALFVIYMHRSNIKRLINHQESKLFQDKKNKQ